MLSSVISSFKPLIVVSYAVGLLLFTFNPRSARAELKPLNWLMMVVTAALNALICGAFWNAATFGRFFATEIAREFVPLMTSVNHLMLVFVVAWNFARRHRFVRLLTLLADIDADLLRLGRAFDYRRQQMALGVFLAAYLLVLAAVALAAPFVAQNGGQHFSVTHALVLLWISVLGVTFILQFVTGTRNIGMRFEMLNECLASGQHVAAVHLKLVRSVRVFNEIFGASMMVAFANYFAWNCMSFFNFAMTPRERRDAMDFVSIALGVVFTWGMLVLMVGGAERATRAKERAVELLYGSLCEGGGGGEGERVQALVSQVVNTSVTFSCQFFDFNWKMLFRFITAGVMYFIILIQFESSWHERKQLELTLPPVASEKLMHA